MRSPSRDSDRPARGRLASPNDRQAVRVSEAAGAEKGSNARDCRNARRASTACAHLVRRQAFRFGGKGPPAENALLELGCGVDAETCAVVASGRCQERRDLLERDVLIDIEEDGAVFKESTNRLLRRVCHHCNPLLSFLWQTLWNENLTEESDPMNSSGPGGLLAKRDGRSCGSCRAREENWIVEASARSAVQRSPAFDDGLAARGVALRRVGACALAFEGLRLRVPGERLGGGRAGGGGVLYALLVFDLRLQLGNRVGAT